MLSTDAIRERVSEWAHESFTFSVSQPYSFRSAIELTYTEPWAGDQYDDVSDVKATYVIYYEHASDEFLLMLPTREYPRKAAPRPEYTIDRDGAIFHDSFDAVEDELFSGIRHELPALDWLADFIERDRFHRFSNVCPGVGPVKCQELYDEYGMLKNVHEQSFETLDNQMWTKAARVFAESSV